MQVQEHRSTARPGRAADQIAAPVPHIRRRLRQRRREQPHRHAAQVPGVRDRLTRNELPGQPVLVLRVLQRDTQIPVVHLDQFAGPLQAFLPVVGGYRDAVPAVYPRGIGGQPSRHLIPDDERTLRKPLQLRRGVHRVLVVVVLLRPDHAEPMLEVAERLTRPEHVHPGRQLHRPRRPLMEMQPGLVAFRDLQVLHAAHRENRDMPFLAGQPVHQLHRRTVRRAVPLDLLGQSEHITRSPVAPHIRQQLGRFHAQGDTAEDQPLEFVTRGAPRPHAESPQHLIELLSEPLHPAAFGDTSAPLEHSPELLAERVSESAAGETDTQVDLALGVLDPMQVTLRRHQMVAPVVGARHRGQRGRRVHVDRAGPLVGRERPRRPAQMQAVTGHARVLLRDRRDERFPLRVGSERPTDLREAVPRRHRGRRERGVPGDLGDREFLGGAAVLLLGRFRDTERPLFLGRCRRRVRDELPGTGRSGRQTRIDRGLLDRAGRRRDHRVLARRRVHGLLRPGRWRLLRLLLWAGRWRLLRLPLRRPVGGLPWWRLLLWAGRWRRHARRHHRLLPGRRARRRLRTARHRCEADGTRRGSSRIRRLRGGVLTRYRPGRLGTVGFSTRAGFGLDPTGLVPLTGGLVRHHRIGFGRVDRLPACRRRLRWLLRRCRIRPGTQPRRRRIRRFWTGLPLRGEPLRALLGLDPFQYPLLLLAEPVHSSRTGAARRRCSGRGTRRIRVDLGRAGWWRTTVFTLWITRDRRWCRITPSLWITSGFLWITLLGLWITSAYLWIMLWIVMPRRDLSLWITLWITLWRTKIFRR